MLDGYCTKKKKKEEELVCLKCGHVTDVHLCLSNA